MAEKEQLDVIIGGENSQAVGALTEVDRELAKTGNAAQLAEKGINAFAHRVDALKKAQDTAAGSAAELSASMHQQVAAAKAAGGSIAGLNQRLVNLKSGREHVQVLYGEVDHLATSALKAGTAILGISAGLVVMAAKSSITAAAERMAIEDGLEAMMGNAQAARKQLQELKSAAALPGVNFDGAIKLSLQLQNVEVSAQDSIRAVKALGNSLALAGKGEQEFNRASTALAQLAGKARMSAEEIMQLTEAGLPMAKLLRQAFGTNDVDALAKMGITGKEAFEKIVAAMEKLPKAAGGVKNALENVGIAFGEIKIQFGKGLLEGAAQEGLDKTGASLEKLEQSAFKLGQQLAPLITQGLDLANALLANDAALLKTIGNTVLWTGGLLTLGGGIVKGTILVSEFKTAIVALKGGMAAAQATNLALTGTMAATPWGATAVAVAALAVTIWKGVEAYNAMHKAQEQAKKDLEANQKAFEQAAGQGWMSEEDAKKSMEVGAPITGLHKPAGGMTPRDRAMRDQQARAGKERSAAEHGSGTAFQEYLQGLKSGSGAASSAPASTAKMRAEVEATPAGKLVLESAGSDKAGPPPPTVDRQVIEAIRRPDTTGLSSILSGALAQRDEAVQQALVTAIRGGR